MKIEIKVFDDHNEVFVRKFNNRGCGIFPDLDQEMIELFKSYSKSIFGMIVINNQFYKFSYSTLGNDGVILDQFDKRFGLANCFLKMIQQAIYCKLKIT